MFPTIVLLTAGLPAFAPAPVFRRSVVTGSPIESNLARRTITLKCGGRERIFKVARDAKFTLNGVEGYSLDDLTEIDNFGAATATLTLGNGVTDAVDLTCKLRTGQKLWKPGMGPRQIRMRETREYIRAAEAQRLQKR